jgi:hypothetical protein
VEEINTELEVRVTHHRQMTGLDLLDVPSHLQHPWILHLVMRRQKLERQIEVLQREQAYRPHTCQVNITDTGVTTGKYNRYRCYYR